MKTIYKSSTSILLPLIFIMSGYIVCERFDILTELQLSILHYAPYAVLAIAAAMAWKFNRSRYFFISVILIICLTIIYHPGTLVNAWKPIYLMLCILLPFNAVIFTILKERGIVSIWGMFRFGFILLQAGLTYWIVTSNQQEILKLISSSLLPVHLKPYITISHTALLVFIFSFILLIIRILLYQLSQDFALLFVLIALFSMLNDNSSKSYSVFNTVIGMILIVSILKDTYVMAFYDELTGIPSRRALNQDLLKLGMKYSIAMLDIDHFKKFNDTYGHDTGDEVLKFIASMIKDVKGGGKAYRYGGEEFTLLFPGKNMNDVIAPLEELREAIAQREFVIRKKRRAKSTNRKKANSKGRNTRSNTDMKKLHIYVSIGVAQKDDNNKTPAYVIKAADSALYRAKKKGRNCLSK